MPDAASLVKTIKRVALEAVEASKPVKLCFGTVESSSPLRINVEQKMVLGEKQLILSRNVVDNTIKMAMGMETDTVSTAHQHSFQGRTAKEGEPLHIHEFTGDTGEAGNGHLHHISGEQEVTLKNSLQAGDKVVLLRQQGGQKYYILDKVMG